MTDQISARLRVVASAKMNQTREYTIAAASEAADHIDTQDAKIKALVEALVLCRDELDAYSQQEYPSDHPNHVRCRKRDYDANPARAAIATPPNKSP